WYNCWYRLPKSIRPPRKFESCRAHQRAFEKGCLDATAIRPRGSAPGRAPSSITLDPIDHGAPNDFPCNISSINFPLTTFGRDRKCPLETLAPKHTGAE